MLTSLPVLIAALVLVVLGMAACVVLAVCVVASWADAELKRINDDR